MFRVFVEDLEFYAFHGVPNAEQEIGHRYLVTVSVLVNGLAHETDAITDTVDYGEIAKHIEFVAKAERYRTLEGLGQVICQTILMRFPDIRRVDLRLAKRLPPADIIAAAAGIEIMMERP
ncbi:MAG: dihydroneopterin aldolase [Fimbriimonadaceae bacterium]